MRSRKIIKKFVQLTAILLLIVFALPAIAYLMLQSSRIQTYVTSNITRTISDHLDTKFTIGTVNISFFYRVWLNDVYLEDMQGDTLLYAKSIIAGIRNVNPLKKALSFGSVDFNEAFVNLSIDSARIINIKYLVENIKSKDQKNGNWKISFNNMRLNNSRLHLNNYYYKNRDYGINFTDLNISEIDADIKRFAPSQDSLSFHINSLKFKESSGFILDKLTADFSQSKTFLKFQNLTLTTPTSSMTGNGVSFLFDRWSKFKRDSLFNGVNLMIDIANSSLSLDDLSYYASVLRNSNQQITFTGQLKGPIKNLQGRSLAIGFGDSSVLKGEISMDGLPEIYETFIYADIKDFKTTAADLNSLILPGQTTLNIPAQMNTLGLITYNGKFTGFINDFVAFGSFQTDLGMISTDLLFKPDTLNSIGFNGQLTASGFDIGRMLEASQSVGKISLSANVNGSTSAGRSVNATMNGMIQQFEVRNYSYQNIRLAGNLNHRTFNGSVHINDPNIELEFLGQVDLSDSVAAYDFTANVAHANLYELNIDRSDPDFTASFYMIANATGQTVNSLNGEIILLNSIFKKKNQELQIQDFTINASNTKDTNHLNIRSDYIDMDITGNYELDKVNESVRQFLYSYLPSLADTTYHKDTLLYNRFNLYADIKNIQPILDIFMPAYHLAERTTVECNYSPDNQNLLLYFQTPQFGFNNMSWNNLNIAFISDSSILDIEAGGSSLMLGNQITLENFTVYSKAYHDTLNIEARWNNWQELLYRGNIRGFAYVSRLKRGTYPHVEIVIDPTSFYANDSLWNISQSKITIDTNNIKFDNIKVSHNNQFFSLTGMISKDPSHKLEMVFNQFNLDNLNGITMNRGYELEGILNGNASFSSLYHSPLFISRLTIDSLTINHELLGSSEINSTWDDDNHAILIDAYAMRDDLKTVEIAGNYSLGEDSKLDFDLSMDKFRLNLFNPYVERIFSDLRGIATGSLKLTGTAQQPVLNGEINLQKTAFGINYLKTRYSFSENIQIINNNISFKDVLISDARANSAYLTGTIRSNYLKDFQLDLTLRSGEFQCLNTSQTDNHTFYGTAYAKDLALRIVGPPKNITIDVSAATAENTIIYIPLSDERELNEYNFISVYIEDSIDEPLDTPPSYQVDLSGLQLNLDLEVTPDAEVQIIFDPKLGDIIRGKGNGNLDMKINTGGEFVIYGDYIIEEGDYMFTLQNIITKRLTIEEGSSIRWNGDPLDASINMVAYYRTKASLNDLLGTVENNPMMVVDNRLTMTGKLMAPDVQYDIYLPFADETSRLKVNSAIASSEELNRQFISLLVQNRFVLSNERVGQASTGASSSPYSNVAGVNASEFLSNQLSHWLSQISNDVDIGINYRTNREMKSDEVQLALETQLFNDRLTINGSLDVPTNAAAEKSDNIVGEFDIDYKLTRNGKFRIKTYNHLNNELFYENSPYTQGFGIFYKEEFNSLKELWKRYWQKIFGRKEEDEQNTTDN